MRIPVASLQNEHKPDYMQLEAMDDSFGGKARQEK